MRNDARGWFAAVGLLGALLAPGRAEGQGAVAVAPQVGMIPDGIGLGVTPAVSADRRYVRLSVGFGSQTVQGFQNIGFPAGAVGGGGGGVPSVLTGMNGPIGPGGMTGGDPSMMAGTGYGPGLDDFSGMSSPDFFAPRATPHRAKVARPKVKPPAVAAKKPQQARRARAR